MRLATFSTTACPGCGHVHPPEHIAVHEPSVRFHTCLSCGHEEVIEPEPDEDGYVPSGPDPQTVDLELLALLEPESD